MIKFIKGFFQPLFYLSRSLYFLVFLNGVLITAIFFSASESNYERRIFDLISERIKEEYPATVNNKDSFAIKAMAMSNSLQERRYSVFGFKEISGFKASIMHPVTVDLMTGRGGCGSYVNVLARILKGNNYKIRIAQMEVNGIKSGHVVMEAWTGKHWIALDPMLNHYFINPSGEIASISDLNSNWNYYKAQAGRDYPADYSYLNIRYTNWDKIPVLMPAMKGLLNITIGKQKADEVSLRPYFLRVYHITSIILILIYLGILFVTFKRVFSKKKISLRPISLKLMQAKRVETKVA